MEKLEKLLNTIDNMLDSKRKRFIVGGMLLSTSLFLGGLAATTMLIKNGGEI